LWRRKFNISITGVICREFDSSDWAPRLTTERIRATGNVGTMLAVPLELMGVVWRRKEGITINEIAPFWEREGRGEESLTFGGADSKLFE